MSVTLQIDNYSSVNIKDETLLTEKADIGATTLTVVNANEFSANAIAQLGSPNTDDSEVRVVVSSTGNVITIAEPTSLFHGPNTRVVVLVGNQIRIYRAANVNGLPPSDGDFSELETVDIDIDEMATQFVDDDGSSSYWYKYVYINVETNEMTDLADCIAERGGNVGNYISIDEIRGSAGLEGNRYITDGYISSFRAQAQAIVNSSLYTIYTIPFEAPVNAVISRITLDIAVGYLLIDVYGYVRDGSSRDGDARIKSAMDTLERIQKGSLVLLDGTGAPAAGGGDSGGSGASSTSGRVTSWPNDTTATTPTELGGGAVIFEVGKRF